MRLQHVAGLALSLSLAACAMEVEGEDTVGLDESEQITFNQITFNQITFNGITGSIDALVAVTENPLATATFADDGALAGVLENADTRVFLKYLASCALDEDDPVIAYTDQWGKEHTFAGGLGLCSAWAGGAPDTDCQEIVSACIFARNNAYGKSKMVSPRGITQEGTALPTAPFVPAKPTTITGASIPSFNACKVAQAGAARNCGWAAEQSVLGTCTPGKDVTLTCGSVNAQGLAARVCDGIEGCANGATASLAQAQVCTPATPSLGFKCGPDGAFAAMIGPVTSGQAFGAFFSKATGGSFPASERQLFSIREGAFYGNLFNSAAHSPDVTTTILANGQADTQVLLTSGALSVYQDAFACHDPDWTTGAAYLHDRLCAIVINDFGAQVDLCVAARIGACLGGADPKCAVSDVGANGDKDFGQCVDGNDDSRDWPLTVMLHQPCDLLPPGHEASCQRRVIIR